MPSPHPPDVLPDAPGLRQFIVKLKSQLDHETRYNALVEKLGAKWQHDEPAPKWTPTVDESVVTRWQVAHHRNLIDETHGHEPPWIVDLAWTRDSGKDIHAEMADDETDGYSPPWQHDAGKIADTWEGVGWKEQAAYLRAKTAENGVADILAWLTQQAKGKDIPADSNQDAPPPTDTDKATPQVHKIPPKSRGGRHKQVNARMLEAIHANPESLGWNSTKWGTHLKCARSSVTVTKTWSDLKMARERARAERALDRRRRAKGR